MEPTALIQDVTVGEPLGQGKLNQHTNRASRTQMWKSILPFEIFLSFFIS